MATLEVLRGLVVQTDPDEIEHSDLHEDICEHECPLCYTLAPLFTLGMPSASDTASDTTEVTPTSSHNTHICCETCWRNYCINKSDEGVAIITCFARNCKHQLSISELQRFLPEDKWNRHEQTMLKHGLKQIPNLRFCPGVDCPYAVVACRSHRVIECELPNCKTRFCFNCRKLEHPGKPCRTEDYGDDLINKSVKICPTCLVPTTKNEGCNEIHCTCGTDWCWLCGQETSILHFSMGKRCSRFGAETSMKRDVALTGGGLALTPLILGLGIPAFTLGTMVGLPILFGRKVYRQIFKRKRRLLEQIEKDVGHPLPSDERREFLQLTASEKAKRGLTTTGAVVGGIIAAPSVIVLGLSLGIPALLVYSYIVSPISLIVQATRLSQVKRRERRAVKRMQRAAKTQLAENVAKRMQRAATFSAG